MLDPSVDTKRMDRAVGRVFEALRDEQWHNLDQIAKTTGDTRKTVSSRIRDLRLPQYGGYTVNKQVVNKTTQLWKYKLDLNNKQVTPLGNAANPVPHVAPKAVIAVPPLQDDPDGERIKFFNTNTWKSELVSKKDCRKESDGSYQRVIAVDDNDEPIPYLVTTQDSL